MSETKEQYVLPKEQHLMSLAKPYPPYDNLDIVQVKFMAEMLVNMGYDLTTQHTKMTPFRLVHYLNYWRRPEKELHFTTFLNQFPRIDQMVTIGPISFWSCCSHHMLPFFGTIYFGYIPDQALVGLSKVPQLIKDFCARPWLQETMTKCLADRFWKALAPAGLGLVVKAMHTCQMLDMGPDVPDMTFTEMRGVFRDSSTTREEFLGSIGES